MAAPQLISPLGFDPYFGSDPDVLYYVRRGDPTQLVRRDLATSEERVLFQGKDLTTIGISPERL